MSEAILITRKDLKQLIVEAVREESQPWLTLEEMAQREGVSTKTISARELRGEIPKRGKNGKWLRSEVNEWRDTRLAA